MRQTLEEGIKERIIGKRRPKRKKNEEPKGANELTLIPAKLQRSKTNV